jgi:hypothetical protein
MGKWRVRMGLSRLASLHFIRVALAGVVSSNLLHSRWQFRKQLTVFGPRNREYNGAVRPNGGTDKVI